MEREKALCGGCVVRSRTRRTSPSLDRYRIMFERASRRRRFRECSGKKLTEGKSELWSASEPLGGLFTIKVAIFGRTSH